jgi:hypothetical protein
MNEYKMSKPKVHAFLSQNFDAMTSLTLLETQTTGTLDFTAWEMLLEVEYGVDEPLMGIVKGEKGFVRGVSLQWWRWEGGGDDGEEKEKGEEAEEMLREDRLEHWRIVREHDYMIPLKKGNVGVAERLFG